MKNVKSVVKSLALSTLAAASFQAQAADEAFDVTLKLLTPISISETQSLDFGETVSGSASTIVVAAADANAAVFTATGDASETASVQIVESSITMTTGDGSGTTKQITVDGFSLGGDVSGGAITFTGGADDIRVGATANVEAEDIAGNYAGSATLQVVYN